MTRKREDREDTDSIMWVPMVRPGAKRAVPLSLAVVPNDDVNDELKLIANEGFVRSRLRGLPVRGDGEAEARA